MDEMTMYKINYKILFSVLTILIALGAIFLSFYEFPPRLDRELHQCIGKALATESLNLLSQEGQIIIISRDTEAFKQPALDILLDCFQTELRRAKVPAPTIQLMSTDPLRDPAARPGKKWPKNRRYPAA